VPQLHIGNTYAGSILIPVQVPEWSFIINTTVVHVEIRIDRSKSHAQLFAYARGPDSPSLPQPEFANANQVSMAALTWLKMNLPR